MQRQRLPPPCFDVMAKLYSQNVGNNDAKGGNADVLLGLFLGLFSGVVEIERASKRFGGCNRVYRGRLSLGLPYLNSNISYLTIMETCVSNVPIVSSINMDQSGANQSGARGPGHPCSVGL